MAARTGKPSTRIATRVSASDRDMCEAAAEAAGMTLGAWMREVLITSAYSTAPHAVVRPMCSVCRRLAEPRGYPTQGGSLKAEDAVPAGWAYDYYRQRLICNGCRGTHVKLFNPNDRL